MPVGPRIIFVRFLRGDSPKLMPWRAHATRVLGVVEPARVPQAGDTDGQLVWQLVSGNNRQLGRSVGVYPTFEAAAANAQRAVDAANQLEIHHTSEGARGVYGWYASVAGEPVITCARWYLTDRDRRHSVALAVRAVGVATLHEGARLTDPSLLASTDRSSVNSFIPAPPPSLPR